MPNQLKVGSMVTPTRANGGITSGCILYSHLHQATTDAVCSEDSGAGTSFAAGANLVPATAFASPQGFVTAEATATETMLRMPFANFNYSYNAADTLLIATRIKLTALPTGSARAICAQGGGATNAPGWRLLVSTTGTLSWALDTSVSTTFGAASDAGGPTANGVLDTNWRSVVFAWWSHVLGTGSNGTSVYSYWIDGEPALSGVSPYRLGSALLNSVVPNEAYRIGGYYRSTGPSMSTIGATQANHHVYRAPVGVTNSYAKMAAIAKRLHLAPHVPLSAVEWPMS